MKKQRRFNIKDDVQLNYVICALDDIDYELSLYQYRVANEFEHSEEAYDALGRARALYCMSFSAILWESLTVQKVRASMNPVNKMKQIVFVLEAAAAVDDLLDTFQRELKETLDETDDAMRKLWHLRLALRKEINTNFKDPRASESNEDE